jgi:hypothetical protein
MYVIPPIRRTTHGLDAAHHDSRIVMRAGSAAGSLGAAPPLHAKERRRTATRGRRRAHRQFRPETVTPSVAQAASLRAAHEPAPESPGRSHTTPIAITPKIAVTSRGRRASSVNRYRRRKGARCSADQCRRSRVGRGTGSSHARSQRRQREVQTGGGAGSVMREAERDRERRRIRDERTPLRKGDHWYTANAPAPERDLRQRHLTGPTRELVRGQHQHRRHDRERDG